MLESIQAGDHVVTTGGIVGTVVKIDKDSLRLKLAPSVEVTLVRSYVVGKAPEGVS
jgi:preprotein translocase YajC subunit